MKTLYGLIGFPLGHSFSERYFAEKFQAEGLTEYAYRNFPIESIEQLPALLAEQPCLKGFNVTIPYKEQVFRYLDAIDPEAAKIGAVNCVSIDSGRLTGYNTDVYGFRLSLLQLLGEARPSALILGTGGASKAVAYVLEELGIAYTFVSRSKRNGVLTYADLSPEVMDTHRLIVNATPVGTYPRTEECPALHYQLLTPAHFLFDLVYNPPLTRFLAQGEQHGAHIKNGYDMLVGQAEKAWKIWMAPDSKNQ